MSRLRRSGAEPTLDPAFAGGSVQTPAVERRLFSYSSSDHTRLQRTVIRTIEFLGGRPKLWRLYQRQQRGAGKDETFFDAAIRLLDVNVRFDRAMLDKVPRNGPVLFIANHPYGVLDGIVLTWLAMQVRPEVRILANSVLGRAPEVRAHLLPIDFANTKAAMATTIASRRAAQTHLNAGDAIGIFPAGGVSTAPRPMNGPALDLEWIPYTARLIHSARATVVPLYFSGQNSRLFQLASHISPTLRLSLMFHETVRRMGTPLNVTIGEPIPYEVMEPIKDRQELVRKLRTQTFALANRPDVNWMDSVRLPA